MPVNFNVFIFFLVSNINKMQTSMSLLIFSLLSLCYKLYLFIISYFCRSHGKSRRKEKSKKSKIHEPSKSPSRSPSVNKSLSRSRSPSYSRKTSQSPAKSPENDYVSYIL